MRFFDRIRAYNFLPTPLPNVDATKLVVTLNQTYTAVNENTSITITATDAYGVRDYSYTGTITLTSATGTITSGGSGTMVSGILTLSSIIFDTAVVGNTVTASTGILTDGVSDTFNVKYETPPAITGLSISPNVTEFYISWANATSENVLVIAKKLLFSYEYPNESGMDNETTWSANTVYETSETPSDSTAYVVYSGTGTGFTLTGLIGGETRYAVTAYTHSGTLNSALMNFNKSEVTQTNRTLA